MCWLSFRPDLLTSDYPVLCSRNRLALGRRVELQVEGIARQIQVNRVIRRNRQRPAAGPADALHRDLLLFHRYFEVLRLSEDAVANLVFILVAVGLQYRLRLDSVLELVIGEERRHDLDSDVYSEADGSQR